MGCGAHGKHKVANMQSRSYKHSVTHKPALDKWTEPQIKLLKQQFRLYAKGKVLDIKGFRQMFFKLNDAIVEPVFKIFDIHNQGKIDFTEYCLALSRCILGSKEDKLKFVFEMYDFDRDGVLNPTEIQCLIRAEKSAIRKKSSKSNPGNSSDELISQQNVTVDKFLSWGESYLSLERILIPFEIIPTPTTEKLTIKRIMQEFTGRKLRIKEQLYIISKSWWDAWTDYVFYNDEEESVASRQSLQQLQRMNSYRSGEKPINIDNSDIQGENKEELRKGMIEEVDYVVLPEEAWSNLFKWYGGGPTFQRVVIFKQRDLQIDLYPTVLWYKVRDADGKIDNNESKILISSDKRTLQDAAPLIQRHLTLDAIYKIWTKTAKGWAQVPINTQFSQIENVVVIDAINQEEGPEDKTQNSFAVGDMLDIQRAPGYWVPGKIQQVLDDEIEVLIEKERKSEMLKTSSEDIAPAGSKTARMTKINFQEIKASVGLHNMGNTCYLNCSIQCLSNTPLLKTFFGHNTYQKYINYENKMGSEGKIAQQFGALIAQLWNSKTGAFRPDAFRKAIIKQQPDFDGFMQHDVHEFLGFLLDILHEDLLRSNQPSLIRNPSRLINPQKQEMVEYAEKQWSDLMRQKGSVISDLFGGQTRTTIHWHNCDQRTILFENYMVLSLPVSSDLNIDLLFTFKPLLKNQFLRFGLTISKFANLGALVSQVAELVKIDKTKIILANVKDSKINIVYNYNEDELLFRLGITSCDTMFAFEVHGTIEDAESEGRYVNAYDTKRQWGKFEVGDQVDLMDTNDDWQPGTVIEIKNKEVFVSYDDKDSTHDEAMSQSSDRVAPFRQHTKPETPLIYHVPVVHRNREGDLIAPPWLLSVGSWYTWDTLKKAIGRMVEPFHKNGDIKLAVLDVNSEGTGSPCPKDPEFNKWINNEYKNITFVIEWSSSVNLVQKDHRSYTSIKNKPEKPPIDISSSFENFTKEEKVELKWENCKQSDNVTQKMEIWRLPEIMIIHLKRFHYEAGAMEKIDDMVEFPLFAFDVNEWVESVDKGTPKKGLTMSSTSLQNTYDLFAVVNHMGNIGSGHYTAFWLNEDNRKWLLYNDDEVIEVLDDPVNSVINRNAYILFYRRRILAPSIVIELEEDN